MCVCELQEQEITFNNVESKQYAGSEPGLKLLLFGVLGSELSEMIKQ